MKKILVVGTTTDNMNGAKIFFELLKNQGYIFIFVETRKEAEKIIHECDGVIILSPLLYDFESASTYSTTTDNGYPMVLEVNAFQLMVKAAALNKPAVILRQFGGNSVYYMTADNVDCCIALDAEFSKIDVHQFFEYIYKRVIEAAILEIHGLNRLIMADHSSNGPWHVIWNYMQSRAKKQTA